MKRPLKNDAGKSETDRQSTVETGNHPDMNAAPTLHSVESAEGSVLADRAAETEKPGAAADTAPAQEVPASRRKMAATVIIPLALIAALTYGYYYWTFARFQISTDDAYIGADIATLSAKVSGYVEAVEVADHAEVKTGDIIARIDDGDYRLAVRTAKDKIAMQQAVIARIDRQIAAQRAAVDQARAQLTANEADAKRAALELERQKGLAKRDYSSHQTLEQAEAANAQAVASIQSAGAAVEAALANGEVIKAQKVEAEGGLKELQTALAIAERDLSFTVIRAPFDGVIGNRAMQKGDLVQPGQRLGSLVPLDHVYIDANFKETQLERLRPGQPVEIEIDALPDHVFHGKVVSFAPASGSIFSLLPPENATGNFTKVVQRVPVRIRVEQRPDERGLMRPGMSVVVRVDTKSYASSNQLAAEPSLGKSDPGSQR